MAFAKQFFSSYKSNNNLDYYLEIWVDGFDSSATEISVGAGGPVISYETDQEDRFSPILSSQCELPFVVKDTSLQAFIQLLRTTYQERQVYLHLYRATSSTYTTTKPIWSGFLVMDLGSGIDVSFPYEQKLTFVDGLSLLKDIDFVDLSNAGSETNIQGSYTKDNMYYGPAIYTFWIKEILAKAGCATTSQGVSIDYGFTTAVNWYNADMQNTNQGSDPLGLTQCVVSMFHNKNDQDVFTPENCYTVLKELLRHWGARITYWKHEFWIVQIPEYIQDESGLIDNPDNINSRQYNRFGTLTGSQDHLGDTYYTRYEQTIQSNQVSKLVGTKYNYLPMIHNADADFLSFASKNYYGGFPYGVSAESQEIFQGTIIDPSTANFLWLSVPLNWTWDMTGSSLTNGHENGWWCSVRFNFYASDGTTTYYLQYDSSGQGSYYWVLEADWTPLGNTSPKYIIKSRNLTETNYIGFQESIPFVDSSGSAITMTGAWSFFLDIEDFANQSSSGNNGSFYCRFSGYAPSSFYDYVKKDPYQEFPYLPTTSDVSGGGPQTKSGKVSWSNTLENPSGMVVSSFSTPAGFNAGTSQADIQLITTSAFKGLLQTLNTTQTSSFGLSLNTQVNNSTNTEKFSFGTLLWGDAIQQFAVGCLRVNNGTAFVKTNPDGEWGRGTLTGNNTFTELLIDEFLSGQIKVVIAPTMRLAVGEENKNQTASGTGGPATRPRYVNPIGRLREFRSNETDPEYIFRRGSFYSLYDEWDYEGYQILRDTVSSTTTTTDIGDLGGTQDNKPISNAKIIGNVNNALMMNSPVAYLRTTVPATGSNVAVNGNFNTAVGWTLGTGWSIDTTAKKAKFAATGSTSELTQSVLTQGLTYQVNFQVVVTAGTLLVKAGTSGTSLSITTSGDYSFYLDCDGSNLIKFQAGTTFTGNITYITLRDQKSISSVPINSIGSTVFKSGDTFNLINSLGGEILPLTVSSNQGATDDTISVTSTALFDDIGIDSVLLINQDDLSAQYQNKTKGTVAGFGIDADGISKGGIEITGWLNSDTMSGAAVTNVPTALSVKNYVDGQVGASDTLQEVTDNGNTTTNSVNIGSSTAPAKKLTVTTSTSSDGILGISTDGSEWLKIINTNSTTFPVGQFHLYYGSNVAANITALSNEMRLSGGYTTGGKIVFRTATTERMRLTDTGLGIGTTSPATILEISDDIPLLRITGTANRNWTVNELMGSLQFYSSDASGSAANSVRSSISLVSESTFGSTTGLSFATKADYSGLPTEKMRISAFGNVGINTNSPTEKLHVVGDALITGDSHADAFKPAVSGNPIKFKNFGSTELARITDGGNLLIGTTTDSGPKLQVNGGITLTDNSFLTWQNSFTRIAGQSGYMVFQIATAEKMRVTSTGLGIGTSSVSNALQIGTTGATGRIYFSGNAGGGGSGILYKDVSGQARYGLHFEDDNKVILSNRAVNGTVQIRANTSSSGIGGEQTIATFEDDQVSIDGKLGIGTSSPAQLLTLYKDSGDANLLISSNNGASQIFFGDTEQDNIGKIDYDHSDNSLNIAVNNAERMRLTSGGNLGIGLTNPDKLIDVASSGTNTNAPTIRITNTANNSASNWNGKISHAIEFYSSDPSRVGLASSIQNIAGTDKGGVLTGNITFNTADWPTNGITERMRITDGGNVGIGTTNPEAVLEIESSSANLLKLYRTNSSAAAESIISFDFNNASAVQTTYAQIRADVGISTAGSHDGILQFHTASSGTVSEKMRLTSGGNVLIGTTTDSGEKLVLNGNQRINTGEFFITESGSSRKPVRLHKVNYKGAITLQRDADNNVNISSDFTNLGHTYFDGNGVNVGVAIRNPTANLHVNGTTTLGTYLGRIDIVTTGATVAEGPAMVLDGRNLTLGSYDNGRFYVGIKQTHTNNTTNDDTIQFICGDSEKMRLTSGGSLLLGTTTDSGEKLQVNGNIKVGDSNHLLIGSSSDLDLYHTGTNSFVENWTGDLYIRNNSNGNDVIFQCDDGSGGITEYFKLDGSQTGVLRYTNFPDNSALTFGDGNDLRIYHYNQEQWFDNSTGNWYFRQLHDNSDIIFQCDNGTGGQTAYITLDGSQTTINVYKNLLVGTTVDSGLYKIDVAGKQRVQSVLELEDVLTLNAISTPADPASGKSSIYMDSADGAIKVKINVGGTVVTRTIASFE